MKKPNTIKPVYNSHPCVTRLKTAARETTHRDERKKNKQTNKTKQKKKPSLGGHGQARRTVKAVKRCCELLYNYGASSKSNKL